MRVGLIAKKIGMTSYYAENGERIPVTMLQVEKNQVVSVKSEERDGYKAVQVAGFDVKVKNLSKSVKTHYAKNKVAPKRLMKEFRVTDDGLIASGTELFASHFVKGQYLDVIGVSKGKGFAGVMKRWNFGGLRASHGVSIAHRSAGSTGQCQDPGRVPKGKKMAGQMGNKRITTHNLQVVDVDEANNFVLVKGAVPGSKGSYIKLRDAIKKALPLEAAYPTTKQQNSNETESHVKEEK